MILDKTSLVEEAYTTPLLELEIEVYCEPTSPWNRKRINKHKLFYRQYWYKKSKENYWKKFLKK